MRRHDSGSWSFWVSAKRHRSADGRRQLAHPGHLALRCREVLTQRAGGRELEDPGTELTERAADAEQLVFGGERAGHRLTVDRHVRDRARGRHTERAGLDRLAHDDGHRFDVGLGRGLVLRAPLAHHVAAHGAVGDLRADVDHLRHPVDRVEVLGEGLPAPLDPVREGGAGDVLDALHEADQPVVLVGMHRREPHAAVAHHDGRDPVPARRREHRVPGDLAVEVRVDVDETGGDDHAAGIDRLAGARVLELTDLGDPVAVDRHVRSPRLRTRPVDERPPADHQVMHGARLGPDGGVRYFS